VGRIGKRRNEVDGGEVVERIGEGGEGLGVEGKRMMVRGRGVGGIYIKW
jgi:hypothetical protein